METQLYLFCNCSKKPKTRQRPARVQTPPSLKQWNILLKTSNKNKLTTSDNLTYNCFHQWDVDNLSIGNVGGMSAAAPSFGRLVCSPPQKSIAHGTRTKRENKQDYNAIHKINLLQKTAVSKLIGFFWKLRSLSQIRSVYWIFLSFGRDNQTLLDGILTII